jgi:hypothetical protein
MSFLIPLSTSLAALVGSSAISLGLGTSGTASAIALHPSVTTPMGSGSPSQGLSTCAEPDPVRGGLGGLAESAAGAARHSAIATKTPMAHRR